MSVKGYSQSTIANVLNVSQGLISSDIAYLRQKAKEALADYLK
jgi:DNA-directed RNA polymerase specialized sigma24 family protein